MPTQKRRLIRFGGVLAAVLVAAGVAFMTGEFWVVPVVFAGASIFAYLADADLREP